MRKLLPKILLTLALGFIAAFFKFRTNYSLTTSVQVQAEEESSPSSKLAEEIEASTTSASQVTLTPIPPTPTVTPPLNLAPDNIYQKQRLEAEIVDAKRILLGQLEEYSHQERKYNIAVNQFQTLKTLESIEDAVAASKEAMLLRNQVLETYLNLLRLKLINSEGIEIDKKDFALSWLEANIRKLRSFKSKVEPVDDRVQINSLADDFQPLGADIKESAAYATSLLEIGKLQAIYDQASVLAEEIETKQATTSSALVQARNKPALRETKRLMSDISQLLKEIWFELQEVKPQKKDGYAFFNRRLSDDLDPVYSKLSQLLSYFEELLKNDKNEN